jgi:hypothetical protein
MMTREKQMSAAIKLLKPHDKIGCTKLLVMAFDFIDVERKQRLHEKGVASKRALNSLKAYRLVLRRAKAAQNGLPAGVQHNLKLLGSIDGLPELVFEKLLAACDDLLRVNKPTSFDNVKWYSAVWAKDILDRLGKESPLTRGGAWPELAAILYGESANLLHHCALVRDSRNAGKK